MYKLFHTLFKPYLYISHHPSLSAGFPTILLFAVTSACFSPPLLSHSEYCGERGEVLEVKLPLFHTSLSLSLFLALTVAIPSLSASLQTG